MDNQRKKSRLSELHWICLEAKLYEKCFFLDSLQFYTFVRTVNKTHSKISAKKSPVGSPNCLVRFQMKDSNEMTFFWTYQIQKIFQTLSGKSPAVLWKHNSTRPDEPMKKEVSIRSSLIPKNFFGIWRRFFGFRLKHFCMVGDTAFYACKETIEQEFFRNNFCF